MLHVNPPTNNERGAFPERGKSSYCSNARPRTVNRFGLSKGFIGKFLGAVALGFLSTTALAQTKVIGYIPAYKGLQAVANKTDFTKLTHLNLSFLNPNSSGVITSGGTPVCMEGGNASELNYVIQKAHQNNVKVLISLAGGVIPGCSGNWETLLQPANRQNLVNNLLQFVSDFNLDGIDVDIEGVVLTNIDTAGNYTPFIQALSNGLKPAGKLLTTATASYNGGMVPTSSLTYFDFVNIMSYDAIGPGWGTPGIEHSSYDQAVANINTWKARGLTKDKLILGVPFYGYGFGNYGGSYTINDILNQYGVSALQQDVIGTVCVGCSYITYNGIPTIRNKTKLALQQGSGVMIWELSQDATGANSLLAAISSEIAGGGTSSSVGSVTSKSSSSSIASSVASSSSTTAGQQCNWWGTYYTLCKTTTGNWGYENGKDCINASYCATLAPPYGIVGIASSASSIISSISSSSVKSSSSVQSSSSVKSSSSSSVVADIIAPSIPTGLASTARTTNSVSLSWTASTDNIGVTGYRVTYGSTTVDVAGTSTTIIGLTANTNYSFTVKAKDAAGNFSAASSALSVTTSAVVADTVAPSTPANLRSTDQTDSTVTLAWDPSTDNVGVASYIVTYSFGTKTLTVTTTTASISGLSANTAYTFYVKAKDAAGNTSGDSPNLVVTTKPTSEVVKATGVPGVPHLSHNNWSGDSAYNLHMTMWYGNNGSKWEVYENGNLFYSANITDNSPYQQDASLDVSGKSNGTYNYYTKLINSFGTATSDTITVTVTKGAAGDTTPPTVPQTFALTGKTSSSVSLSWAAATDNIAVTGYVITGGPSAINVTGTSTTVTGLAANTAYSFTVKAKDAAGNLSAASSVINVTTSPNVVDTTPPTTPTNLASTGVTSASVSLSWGAATDNIGVTGYVIYYGSSSVNVTGTSATVSNLASNTNYTFTIKALDGSGNLSAASNAVTAKTSPFNGVEPAQLLFDDFTYATPDDASFLLNWKASDYGPAAPGVGVFSKNNVLFLPDATNASNKQMRILFKTSGSRETTIQGEVEGKKQFLYGTYATRMRLYNQPIEGPSQVVGPDTGDRMIETFFTISPYYVPNTDYGELDFEYLPNAGWNADEGGRFTGPTMWNTTWKNRDTRVTKPTQDDFSGWHTFWMTVTPTAVTYYIDDRLMVQHTNVDYIPKTTMYLMYNIWISGEMFAAGQNGIARTWAQDVDWVYYAKDTTLTRSDVEAFVSQYKSQNIPKKDTLPAPN